MGAVRRPGVRPGGRLSDRLAAPGPWRGGWRLISRRAPAGELTTSSPDPCGDRLAVLCQPTDEAVVLGSTQSDGEIDRRAAASSGIQVVRRRSGGGAVFVAPEGQLWLDLFVPVGDPLHQSDVGRAALWVGEMWKAAIGVRDGLDVAGGVTNSRFSRRVCFAGRGAGELFAGRRKVVGVSQRRDRRGAWFFSMGLLRNDQPRLAWLLPVESETERRQLLGELSVATLAELGAPVEMPLRLAEQLGAELSAGEDVPAEPRPADKDHRPRPTRR